MQRLPKLPGFRSIRTKAELLYTGQLDGIGAKVTNETAYAAGLVSSPHTRVKLVVNGNVTRKVAVELQAASESAISQIKKAGGSFSAVPQIGRKKQTKPETKK
jgi:ribosomal protein L15